MVDDRSEKQKIGSGEIKIDIPERLERDVKKFIEERPELGFESVDEFVANALVFFFCRLDDR